MLKVHPYNNNSDAYNFFFHPLHSKKKIDKTCSVIVNIVVSLFTLGVWQIPFWIINRLDNRKLEVWKKEQASKIDKTASKNLPKTSTTKPTSSTKKPPMKKEWKDDKLHIEPFPYREIDPNTTSRNMFVPWIYLGNTKLGELSSNGEIYFHRVMAFLEKGKNFGGKADGLRTGNTSVPHGKGSMSSSYGSLKCHFEYGELCGQGKLQLSDGTVYVGEFANDSFHGQGKLTLSNGKVYEGKWESGELFNHNLGA